MLVAGASTNKDVAGMRKRRVETCVRSIVSESAYPEGKTMIFARWGRKVSGALLVLGVVGLFIALGQRVCAGQAVPAPDAAHADARGSNQQPAYSLPPDKLAKAIALGRIRNVMDIVGSLWGLAVLWLLIAHAGARMEAWTERVAKRRWLQGLLFFAIFIVGFSVASLPLGAFAHHVSLAYGISVQGWGSWLLDQAKGLGLAVAIGAPVLLLFNWIVRRWPRRYWQAAWVATLPLLVLVLFVSPLLEPVFNDFEPLSKEHSALVTELERVVARTGTNIPPERMFLMKASRKTTGLNAYVSGIGATKRIVVWDTTAGRIPNDEVMFVFGHESGHYVLNHIPKWIVLVSIALFFVYWACAWFARWLAGRFGARWGVQDLASRAGFLILLFSISLAGFLMEPVSNTFSRHFEHEADVYGQEAIHGIVPDAQKTAVAGFDALGEAWLEDPNPSPLIEFWEYDHPSVKTRANFAAQYDPWANGGRGEFFGR
jgi:STE24 endopeptidase